MKTNHQQLSDQEILIRYKHDHDNEWIGLLFERYVHLLLGLCMKYLKNVEDAKDSVQQIFIKVLKELPRSDIQHFKAWLYQVAKNHCLMQLRHPELRRPKEINEQVLLINISPEEKWQPLQKERQLQKMEEALQLLNKEQQTCLKLFYLEKKSYEEITHITGFTLLQVKSYIQNGKRNLRIMMEKMHADNQ